MKIYYDDYYSKLKDFSNQVYLKIAKLGKKEYQMHNQTKLSLQRLSPLKVICKVSDLTYEIELLI